MLHTLGHITSHHIKTLDTRYSPGIPTLLQLKMHSKKRTKERVEEEGRSGDGVGMEHKEEKKTKRKRAKNSIAL